MPARAGAKYNCLLQVFATGLRDVNGHRITAFPTRRVPAYFARTHLIKSGESCNRGPNGIQCSVRPLLDQAHPLVTSGRTVA